MGDFFNYGTLPKVCIHTPKPDNFSDYYSPRGICKCGSSDWIDGEMDILKSKIDHVWPKKPVHRCKKCEEVRLSDLKEKEED